MRVGTAVATFARPPLYTERSAMSLAEMTKGNFVLGLGTAPLSGMVLGDGLYGGTAHEEAISVIDRARELGISYVDTAPLYGTGRAEARVGKSAYAVTDRDRVGNHRT